MESFLLVWLYVCLPAAAFWSDYCFGNSIGRVSPPRLIQEVDSVALLSIWHFQVPCIFIVIMELGTWCAFPLSFDQARVEGLNRTLARHHSGAWHSTREIFRVTTEHCSV